MLYAALILDMIDSKKLSRQNRETVQHFTRDSLLALNRVFQPSLAFAVIFSAGDEMQGLFRDASSALLYYRLLKMLLSPLPLRCGIGLGAWDVKIPDGNSAEQDGPAYHLARLAFEKAHENSIAGILFHAGNDIERPINTLLQASAVLAQKQSLYQNDIHLLIELLLPFFDSQSMDQAAFSDVGDRLVERAQVPYFAEARQNQRPLISGSIAWVSQQEPILIFDSVIRQNDMQYASTLRKGIALKLAEITQTTRQNIDNIIRKADIQAIRNIDLTTLHLIRRYVTR